MSSNSSRAAVEVVRVAASDDRTRYDDVTIGLHWLTVILVLAQLGTSQLWDFTAKPTKHLMIVSHMSFGILLGAIVIMRIIWRFLPGHQVRAADVGWTEALAKGMREYNPDSSWQKTEEEEETAANPKASSKK